VVVIDSFQQAIGGVEGALVRRALVIHIYEVCCLVCRIHRDNEGAGAIEGEEDGGDGAVALGGVKEEEEGGPLGGGGHLPFA
jgi:hypothetical protein